MELSEIKAMLERIERAEEQIREIQAQVDRLQRSLDGIREVNNLWDGS